jgi:predicted molibdopterin-dependent oxidoreductase YjgC
MVKMAFVEGAHTSVRVSPYFRRHYNRVKRNAGKKAAKISAARKLATVTYRVLKEKRAYKETGNINNMSRLPSKPSSREFTPDSLRE